MSERASVDFEQIVLGSLIAGETEPDGFTLAELYVPILRPDDFDSSAHRAIFSAMQRVLGRGAPMSIESVLFELKELRAVHATGEAYVRDLPVCGRSAKDLASYVEKVRLLARARRLGKAAELAAKFYGSNVGAEEFLRRASKLLTNAIEDDSLATNFESAQQGLEQIANNCERREPAIAYESGFKQLDMITGGFHPGTLNIVAARPGIGKTSYAANIAVNIAANYQAPALMFSLEMPPEQIWERVMSSESGVAHDAIRRRDVGPEEIDRMMPVAERARKIPFFIHRPRRGRPDVSEMASLARSFRRQHGGLSVLVVDYIQLAVREGRDSVEQRVAEISGALKRIAMDLCCAVLALSQLNRESASYNDLRPTMAQLRYSGAIEQDADSVMLLYRPKPKPTKDEHGNTIQVAKDEQGNVLPDGYTEVIVDKNRHGPTGTVKLRFLEWLTKFEEAEAQDPQQGYDWSGLEADDAAE